MIENDMQKIASKLTYDWMETFKKMVNENFDVNKESKDAQEDAECLTNIYGDAMANLMANIILSSYKDNPVKMIAISNFLLNILNDAREIVLKSILEK